MANELKRRMGRVAIMSGRTTSRQVSGCGLMTRKARYFSDHPKRPGGASALAPAAVFPLGYNVSGPKKRWAKKRARKQDAVR